MLMLATWQCSKLPPECAAARHVHALAAHAPFMVFPPTEELNTGEGKPTRMTSVGLSDFVPHACLPVMVPCDMGGADWAGWVISAVPLEVYGCSASGAELFGRGGVK